MSNGLEAINSMHESMDVALTEDANQFETKNNTQQQLTNLATASVFSDKGQTLSDLHSDFNELVSEYEEADETRGELQEAREEILEARQDVYDAQTRYGEMLKEKRSDFYDLMSEFKKTIREAERNGVDTTELRGQFDQFTRSFASSDAQPMPGDANGDLVVGGTDATGGVGDVSDLPPGAETVAGWISDFIDAAREEMTLKGDQFDGKEFAEGYDFSQFAGEDPVLVQTFLEQLQAMSERPLDLPSAAEITGQNLDDYMPSGGGPSVDRWRIAVVRRWIAPCRRLD